MSSLDKFSTNGSHASLRVRPVARWVLPDRAEEKVARLQQALRVSPLIAAVLVQRGLEDPTEADDFLNPKLESLHDPFLMRDMDTAVRRVVAAVQSREPILIYGDYDVDGTSSIVVLTKAIEILGGITEYYIPHRLKEGYGMRAEVIREAAERGVRLIISVDTGIRAAAVVELANSLDVDMIVTDHHLPEATLPPALAVLNPNRSDCEYPNKHLCGAGVTFKLVQGMLREGGLEPARRSALLDSFLKPIAIATVADVVPLVDENRVMVRRGLSGLRRVWNPGLKALLTVAGFDEGDCPSAHQVAFRLAPRINAAGRMATARQVIELFMTNDPSRAASLAEELDLLNRERQRTENDIVEEILTACEQTMTERISSGLVFSGTGWHLGVLGIVASRLVERFNRPVFVLSDAVAEGSGSGCLSGSGRSVAAFHLLDALTSMSDLFEKFGGHRQAAGITLRAANLETFRRRFGEYATSTLCADDMRAIYRADAHASFPELTDSCAQQLLSLGPFGFGNPSPIFYTAGAEVCGPPRILKDGKHFSVPLRNGGRMLYCKAWNFGDRAELFERGNVLDLLFHIDDDPGSRKRGFGSWCVTLKDVRKSTSIANS